MKKILILLIVLTLVSCAADKNRCKTPWWELKPNSHYHKQQKQNKIKYKLHRKSERRKHKCRK